MEPETSRLSGAGILSNFNVAATLQRSCNIPGMLQHYCNIAGMCYPG